MKQEVGIVGMGSISALGVEKAQVWENYLQAESLIRFDRKLAANVCQLTEEGNDKMDLLRRENKHYPSVDRSVLLGMYAAQKAVQQAAWEAGSIYSINMGSSRGATEKMEQYYESFRREKSKQLSPLASPSTTLGNLSYWVGNHLNQEGLRFDHSITCSTALHSVLNGVAWLNSGLVDRFLVGGTEAPLTDFTVAQMKALRIYAEDKASTFPCKALDLEKTKNSMVLGEAAACFALSKELDQSLAIIEGIGFATEPLKHPTSISEMGESLYESMQQATQGLETKQVDVIVCHSPGTRKGDQAEWMAIKRLFPENIPALTTNKWKIGHTLGASGAMSLELAILMLEQQEFIACPSLANKQKEPSSIERVLLNAIGFGGNAVSILLRRNKNKNGSNYNLDFRKN